MEIDSSESTWTETTDVDEFRGSARIATYTVLFEKDGSSRSILLCDLDDGRRALATSGDPDMARQLTTSEGCGRRVQIESKGAAELSD